MRQTFLLVLCFVLGLSTVAHAKTCVSKEGAVIAASKEHIEKLVHFSTIKDEAAFNKLFNSNLVGVLKPNVQLDIEDYGLGISKVRPVGTLNSVWILTEDLNCR